MDSQTINTELNVEALRALSLKMDEVVEEVKLLRRSLLGSYDQPGGGMAHKVVLMEQDLRTVESKMIELNDEVSSIQNWVSATKNRAIGASVGVLLAGAGLGAGVTTIISRLLGGP